MSWFVTDHVNHGRRSLNFSDWARYDREDAIKLLKDVCSEVKSGAMPLSSYTPLHPDAKLSPEDVTRLCGWSREESQRLSGQSK